MLPFELPVAFDNLGFFAFLVDVKFRWDEKSFLFNKTHEGVIVALRIIFGKDWNIADGGDFWRVRKPSNQSTIPWQYEIRTRNGQGRVLTVPHPAVQLLLTELYATQSSLILHYASRGNFSLRSPSAVARYTTVRDSLLPAASVAAEGVEGAAEGARFLRSYFVYRDVSAIHQFYDSRAYHQAEKTYRYLLRVDLTRCFDSIYTHSIAWAVHERESVKRDVDGHGSTFASDFDRVMRLANDNETNGIVIGPEASRVFAELILQGVDRSVEARLESLSLSNGREYQILRYVDDYFIFTSREADRDRIKRILEEELRPYRMGFNAAKTEMLDAPFISPMTVAKDRLSKLADENIVARKGGSQRDLDRTRQNLINGFKETLLLTNLKAPDVANFFAAVLERRLEQLYESITDDENDLGVEYDSVVDMVIGVLDTQAYLVGLTPLVTVALKFSRTAAFARRALLALELPARDVMQVDDVIHREASRLLFQLRRDGGLEWIWLLDVMSDLPAEFQLRENEIRTLLGAESTKLAMSELSSLELMALIRYVGPQLSLHRLLAELQSAAVSRVEQLSNRSRPSAEAAMLSLDLVTSPFVSMRTRSTIARQHMAKATNSSIATIAQIHPHWLTRSVTADLYQELRLKRVHEVY